MGVMAPEPNRGDIYRVNLSGTLAATRVDRPGLAPQWRLGIYP